MAGILGLMSSADLTSSMSQSSRREVFQRYPHGSFPLMGLCSLMESEETDKFKFGWHERREVELFSKTVQSPVGTGNKGSFTNAANDTLHTDTGANFVAGTEYNVRVTADTAGRFRERDVIWIRNVPNGAASALLQVYGRVTSINTTNHTVKFRATEALTSVSGDTDTNGLDILVVGTATGEGDRSRSGSMELPIEVENYTQIFRTAFDCTRNALKAGVKWDKTGVYKDTAKQNMLLHMEKLEKAALFGNRGVNTVTNDDGKSVPERLTGGMLWFLKQWELGNTGNGGLFDYRPGGSNISASAWDASDDKRILTIGGTLTVAQFDTIGERAFRHTGNTSFEKIVMCGNGFMAAFQQYCRLQSIVMTKLDTKEEAYGMSIYRWTSPWGDLLFKTHPLLTQHASFRNSAFILDVGSFKYIHAQDADTVLLKNRQNNDTDGRKDEWMTEFGLEVHFPERHMFIDNLTGIVA